MVIVRSFVLVISISAATSSTIVIRTLGSPAMSSRLFGLSSLRELVLVLLLTLVDYSNGRGHARSICSAAQI
jgi:multisubunit Na+/H+ antiporter MnhF subunit